MKNRIRAVSKWRFEDEGIKSGKKEITYLCPGGYGIVLKDGRHLNIDWEDFYASIDFDEDVIISEQESLDETILEDCGFSVADITMELFKENFKEFDELPMTIDIAEQPCDDKTILTCVYFEVFDADTDESIVLVDKR